jgi:NAD(P)-dependent dehydrogenase (short-subunit alcohol dehydrogenase family)
MSAPQTALVTGGSAGIGAAIVNTLLARGLTVLSLDRQPSSLSHERLIPYQVDLLDAGATAQLAGEIARDHEVGYLVHNAGVIRPNPVEATPASDLLDLTQLHLGTALILLKAVLPAMRQHRFGRVVLISSRAALGAGTRTAYSATKAGLIGMGRTWALELAAEGITARSAPQTCSMILFRLAARASRHWRRPFRSNGWARPRMSPMRLAFSQAPRPVLSRGRRSTSAAGQALAR